MKKSITESLVEDILASFERDGDLYLVPVYVRELGTYEWYPLQEEVAELLGLLELELYGEKKRRKRRQPQY